MGLFFRQKSFLGVDIGAGGIKLVELKAVKKRPVLLTYGIASQKHDVHQLTQQQIFNVSGNNRITAEMFNLVDPAVNLAQQKTEIADNKIEEYASMIKKVCRAARTVSRQAIVSLPVSAIFHAIVNLPSYIKKEEMDNMIKIEVKKFIPLPLAEMSLDYQVLNHNDDPTIDTPKDIKILVNAVPNKLIVFYSKIFQTAGLTLLALEPESTALTRSLVGVSGAMSMIIDIGEERTNLFIIHKAVPITHQSINFGGRKLNQILQTILKLDDNLIENVKKDLFSYYAGKKLIDYSNFVQMFGSVVEPIAKEIDLSLELFYKQLGNKDERPQKIILTGGSAFLPYLSDYITAKFDIKTYVGDPWARVVYQQAIRPLLQDIAPRMSVAIGLALRNVV